MYKLTKKQNIWCISVISVSKENSLLIKDSFKLIFSLSPVSNLRTNYHYITGYADPFLFVQGEWLYLFYEEERLKAPASICGLRTKDLKKWEKLGVILKEDFHLSFPYTFKVDGEIYMMPETRAKDAVMLYRATEFPYKWESRVIISGDKYTDSSVINYNGKWFLFTTVWYGEKNGLRIYFADDLNDEWKEHPLSPVHNDLGFSRNGGAVFKYDDKLYRPAQNCTNYYGENVALYEIEKLTTTEYSEKKVRNLIDKSNKWSRYGGHHFNLAEFNSKTIVVMDGITDDNLINNLTRKFFNFYYNKWQK